MTNNSEILVAAVQAFIDPSKAGNFQDRLLLCQNWDALISQAEAHRVSPILWRMLSTVPEGSVPKEVVSQLRSGIDRNTLKNLKAIGDLRRLMDLFERNEIPAIPFKGPVLAVTTYGDLGLRRFDDLDILFPRESVLKARDLLAADGFQTTTELHWNCESAGLRHVHSEFSMRRDQLSLDLHWRLIPEFLPYRVDTEDIWTDLAKAKIAGREMLTLSPEHHLLFLASHGAKHMWYRLGWICDFAQCLKSTRVDWGKMAALTKTRANRLMLSHALSVARDFAGAHLPEEAQRFVDACPGLEETTQRLSPGIFKRLADPDAPTQEFRESYRYAREFDGPSIISAKLWNGMLLAPRETDWKVLHLPPIAYPLYYPYRLIRLAVKYTFGRQS